MEMTLPNWIVLMDNFLFTLYIPLTAVFWSSVIHLSGGKWRYEVRFLMASSRALFPLGFILLLIILANGEHAFPWMAGETYGEPLNAWHNITFFNMREIILYLVVWAYCAHFIKLQRKDFPHSEPADRQRFKHWALLAPFVFMIYGSVVSWDFEMIQMPRWYSAVYGLYHTESMMRAFLGFFIVSLFVLRWRDNLKRRINDYVFNYIGQIMLALTIIWTYLAFMQYIVMWYGDLPEDMRRWDKILDGPNAYLYWVFFLLNSFVPFLMLIFKGVRNSPALLLFPSVSILIGTFIERYMWMLSGEADNYDHTPFLSSWIDVAITAVIFGLGVMLWDRQMKKDGLYYEGEEEDAKS